MLKRLDEAALKPACSSCSDPRIAHLVRTTIITPPPRGAIAAIEPRTSRCRASTLPWRRSEVVRRTMASSSQSARRPPLACSRDRGVRVTQIEARRGSIGLAVSVIPMNVHHSRPGRAGAFPYAAAISRTGTDGRRHRHGGPSGLMKRGEPRAARSAASTHLRIFSPALRSRPRRGRR